MIQWQNGNKNISLLGSYFIDNQPPNIELELKGMELDGKITFCGRIIIIPLIHAREPITRWNLVFKNKEGAMIFSEETEGFPPSQLFWKGKDNKGRSFPNGDYQVILQAWDRADNMAEASQWLTVRHQKPKLEVKTMTVDQNLIVELLHEEDIPIAFWQLKFQSANGVTLKTSDGNSFPAQITFPMSALTEDNKPLSGAITVQDILGNQTHKQIKDLLTYGHEKKETKKDDTWAEEF
ncbi:MAG TPA: hypothetical protein DCX54_02475 [Flavobacteriales bacterium]|nr:hypothetical protein [Flavobacteriales bacterium]